LREPVATPDRVPGQLRSKTLWTAPIVTPDGSP
jgi:hypothetical protein